MALDDILRVCPSPVSPVQIPEAAQWCALESDLGLTLPPDYKAFLARYGSGVLGSHEADGFFDLAYVLSPGAPDDQHDQSALRWMRRLTADIHAVAEGCGSFGSARTGSNFDRLRRGLGSVERAAIDRLPVRRGVFSTRS